jgi:hypothetical protein
MTLYTTHTLLNYCSENIKAGQEADEQANPENPEGHMKLDSITQLIRITNTEQSNAVLTENNDPTNIPTKERTSDLASVTTTDPPSSPSSPSTVETSSMPTSPSATELESAPVSSASSHPQQRSHSCPSSPSSIHRYV